MSSQVQASYREERILFANRSAAFPIAYVLLILASLTGSTGLALAQEIQSTTTPTSLSPSGSTAPVPTTVQDLLAFPVGQGSLQAKSPKIRINVRRADADEARKTVDYGGPELTADVEVSFTVHNPTPNEHSVSWHPVSLPGSWIKHRPRLFGVEVEVDGAAVQASVVESIRGEIQPSFSNMILMHRAAGPMNLIATPSTFNREIHDRPVRDWIASLPPELHQLKEEFARLSAQVPPHEFGEELLRAIKQIVDYLADNQGLTYKTAECMAGVIVRDSGRHISSDTYPTEAAIEELLPDVHRRLKATAERRVNQFGKFGFQFDTLNLLSLELNSQLPSYKPVFSFYPPRASSADDDWLRHYKLRGGMSNFQIPAIISCEVPVAPDTSRIVKFRWSHPISRIPIAMGGGDPFGSWSAIGPRCYTMQLNCILPPWWKEQSIEVEMNLPAHLMPIVASKNKLEIVEVSESTKRFQTTIRDNFHMAVSGLEWCKHLYLDEAACKRLLDDLSTVGPLDLKQHADQMATATLEKTQLNNPQLAAWIAEKSASPCLPTPVAERTTLLQTCPQPS
ncbi:MAG: hypothetical protein Aurels2KO_36600 [Aureliella sp.]